METTFTPQQQIARLLMVINGAEPGSHRYEAGHRMIDRICAEHGIDMGHAEHWEAVMVHIPGSGVTKDDLDTEDVTRRLREIEYDLTSPFSDGDHIPGNIEDAVEKIHELRGALGDAEGA